MTVETGSIETLNFYVPPRNDVSGALPERVEDYWPWISRHSGIAGGKYSWTLQTYLHLKSVLPCRLVRAFPSSGIVVSHRDFLPIVLPPRSNVFLVCIKPDRREHTWAHFYVVQNMKDKIFSGPHAGSARAISYWPQPSLVPRDPSRAERCENVAYFGRPVNLAEDLKGEAWTRDLGALGFTWSVAPLAGWNDYSRADVTVSVRGFGDKAATADPVFNPDSKPPSKLVNSWLAGVPAIVGRESSFASIKTSDLDYIEVASMAELKDALVELRQNARLYREMVAHGRRRAHEFSTEAMIERWTELFMRDVLPAYRRWMAPNVLRRGYRNWRNTARFFASVENLSKIRIHRAGRPRISPSS